MKNDDSPIRDYFSIEMNKSIDQQLPSLYIRRLFILCCLVLMLGFFIGSIFSLNFGIKININPLILILPLAGTTLLMFLFLTK